MWKGRIASDPAICGGRACVRGTRIPVSVVLDNLAEGASTAEVLASYPALSSADIEAAIRYAADLAREELVPL